MRLTSQSLIIYFKGQHPLVLEPPTVACAAVLLGIVDQPHQGLSIILTLRSPHLTHHGGEVCFPGGMWEPNERYPIETALREANEEVSLPAGAATVLGCLKPHYTRRSTQVVPVVALVDSAYRLVADNSEVVETFTVPIQYLLDDQRLRTDIFTHKHGNIVKTLWTPAYCYNGYEIWGFTAGVITHFLNQVFNAGIKREHSVGEKIW